MRKITTVALASALALTSVTTANATTTGAPVGDTATTFPTEERDNDFPWGLLGLLGLAGLLGLKRRDDDHVRTADTPRR